MLPARKAAENSTDPLEIALADDHALTARRGAERLGQRELTADDQQTLAAAIVDTNAERRARAAMVLGYLHRHADRSISLLEQAIEDPVWTVREAAVVALAGLTNHDPHNVKIAEFVAMRALFDRNEFVRDAACQTLADPNMEQEFTRAFLRTALRDNRPPVRIRAVEALSRWNVDGALLHEMLALLDDSHSRVRRRAIMVMPRLGKNSMYAISPLIRRCFEQDARVQCAAIESVRQIIGHSPTAEIRLAVASILAGSATLEELIHRLLNSESTIELKAEFTEVCRRRLAWRKQVGDATPLAGDPLTAMLVSAPERETAWLLAKLVEMKIGRSITADEP